ncbi:MAG: RimK family protein [Phycisphaerales bacterium]|nr:RimK family protein [Phycisphaerales bacterium]
MKPLLVVDSPKRWPLEIPGTDLVSSSAYLSDPDLASGAGRKVFNLCRSFKYQAAGYYVSLLAEARGHRPLPSVGAIQDLRLASVIRVVSQDLDRLIQTSLRPIRGESFELSVYFGRNLAAKYDRLALALFNAFPAPLIRARFDRDDDWRLAGVKILGLGEVPETHRPFVVEQAGRYLRRVPKRRASSPPARYDLAILHDPEEAMPPSNPEALEKMVAAGESCGIRCELVERDAVGRVGEFDALFIRETTQVNHHTYRFARRAQAEGLVVIDDPRSIMRCTNKVYLAETMARHRVATPRTVILTKERAEESLSTLGYPCVLKEPDSAFSAGVVRVDDPSEASAKLAELFEGTDLLVAQEYVPTSFDWRIGVLGGSALFACRYGMAASHWQIVKRDADGVHEGDSECVPIEEAPQDVVRLATRAASLMGDGLYGVDMKVVHGRPLVIEVNDNPNLDAGVEDVILGDDLYLRLMQHFVRRLDTR